MESSLSHDRARRIFVAGSTGATGRTLLPIAASLRVDVVPHIRPASARDRELPEQAAVLNLSDAKALDAALTGCTTVIQLIGTMRNRFAQGDTYESSDIGTTLSLVESAQRCGVDHLVLLSSVGAGKPMGAYLEAKAKAESIVTGSGIDWTILRPSSFIGAGHRPPPGMGAMTRLFGMQRFQPIAIEQLAASILYVAMTGKGRGEVLEGASLWRMVEEAAAP